MAATVNSQITDAVTQPDVLVIGLAPAIAAGNLYVATGQALGNAAHNATTTQNNTNIVAQASASTIAAIITKMAKDAAG